MAAGWSLGANILVSMQYGVAKHEALNRGDSCRCMPAQVRYLGEEGADTPLVAAVSMCNPFNLVRGVLACWPPPTRMLHCGVAADQCRG